MPLPFRRAFFLLVLVVLALAAAGSRSARAATMAGPMDGLAPDATLDRESPRRALEGFLRAGGSGDALRAAHYLDLRSIPSSEQASRGPILAQQFWYVTTHIGRFDLLKISDDAEAAIPKGETALLVGSLDDRDGPVPIAMERVKFPDGIERWIFARSTLAIAPALYAALARPTWAARLPPWMDALFVGNALWQWAATIAAVPAAIFCAWLLVKTLLALFGALARRTPSQADDLLVQRLGRPVRLAVGAIVFRALTLQLALTELADGVLGHVTFTMLIVAGAWATRGVLDAWVYWWEEQLPQNDEPGAEAVRRASHTRAALFERLASMAVVLIGVALAMLQFEVVRGIGQSLLASAGLAGVVLGFAAQRSLGAILGGVQLSIAQPIRLGDAVSIDGDHGTIDRIFLTHVVVRRWDDRRLVYPVARFLDQSFQNLSKFGSEQLGIVVFSCDAQIEVEHLRREVRRICERAPQWDRRVCSLEVTDVGPSIVTLRAIVSAAEPRACEELRAVVREHLMPFLRAPASAGAVQRHPSDLRLRALTP